MKKILITGAGGFVGSRILQQWQGKYELCALPKGFFCTADEALTRAQVEALHPDVILHTAALSDTSYCAQHPAEAYRANVELPVWLARAAQQTKAKLVAFSSDQVYAGTKQQGPLSEALDLHPANIYGQYKLKAEQRVLELCPDSVHLRASWMYDLPGGVYNFGSGNAENMVCTARQFAETLGIAVQIEEESWGRNLVMDTTKLERFGIRFDTTHQGIQRCLKDYGLRTL